MTTTSQAICSQPHITNLDNISKPSQYGKNLINGSEPVKLKNVSIKYEVTKLLLDLATIALKDEI